MLNYVLKPSYEYQVIHNISHCLSNFISWQTYDESFFFFKTKQTDPWRVYSSTGEAKKKMSFKTVAK